MAKATKKTTAAVKAEVVETAKKAVAGAKEVAAEAKETVKKTATRVTKKVSMTLQYGDKEIDMSTLEAKAVAAWVEATGNSKTSAKNIALYVKPEDNAVYYVIEGVDGKVEL